MLATGNSQLPLVAALDEVDVPRGRVTVLHMDEHVGTDADHPASFRRRVRERVAERLHPAAMHYLDGEADPAAEIARPLHRAAARGAARLRVPGHRRWCSTGRAPPTSTPTRGSRRQQVGEGHLATSTTSLPRRCR